MNRRLVGFVLMCALSFLWPQVQSLGADAAKGAGVSSARLSPQSLLPAPPPPANDDFANATVLVGNSGTVAGSNVGATPEVGEPSLAGSPAGTSVWWSWTASFTGNATFDTFGTGFDTLMAAYTGTDFASLTEIASDEYVLSINQSQIVFAAVNGTTYHIVVDGYNATSGTITLNWAQAPAAPVNDDFVNAIAISGASGSTTGTSVWATRQIGDPQPLGEPGDASVWWAWMAPSDGFVSFDTFGSDYDTVLGVFTGPNLGSLTEVASNDDSTSSWWSLVTFPAVAGTTYMVDVDGFNGKRGNIVLSWGPPPPPPNDNFANAIALPGNSGQVAGSNVGATLEPGEPSPYGSSSVWWSWTAPTTGSMTIDLVGSDFDTLLDVYTGTTVTALTQIAFNDDFFGLQSRVDFLAVTGTTYHIAVDGWNGGQGSIVLNYALDSTTYTLTYTAGPNGTLTGATSQVVISGTDGTTVTAVADATYFFKAWSDGNTTNPRQDTFVTADINATAIFAQKFLVQFETDLTPGATLEGDTAQMVFDGDDALPVTARAPAGFRFSHWTLTVGADSAFNPLVVNNVTQPVTCVAHFVPFTWPGYAGAVGVVNLTSGGLELLDPVTQTLHGPYFGDAFGTNWNTSPLDVVLTPDGKTALVGAFSLARINFVDLSLPVSPVLDPTSVTLSFGPEEIALTPDGRYALVTDGGSSPHIGVINVTARTLTQDVITSTTNLLPITIAVASDGQTVLVGDYDHRTVASFLFDPISGTLTQTATIDVSPFSPTNVEFSPDGKTAIVVSADSSTSAGLVGACPVVLRVDAPGAVTLMGFVPLPPDVFTAQSVVFSRRTGDKAYYYAAKNTAPVTDEILVLDVNGPGLVSLSGTAVTLAEVRGMGGFFGVDTVAIEPSGRYLYASNMTIPGPTSPNSVAVIDLATNTETATIAVAPGAFPLGVAFPAFDLCHVVFQTDGTPGASLTGNTSQTLVAWTNSTPVTAVPPAGYIFLGWIGDLPTTSANPLTIRPVAANVTMTALFTPLIPGTGSVTVAIEPPAAVAAGAQWRIQGEVTYHNSGTIESGLTSGPAVVEFKTINGWLSPDIQNIAILTGQTTVTTGTYTLLAPGTGAVRVTLLPAAAVAAGAQWRLVTATTTTLFFASGHTEAGLTTGPVTVEFKQIPAWTEPANQPLVVVAGQTTQGTGTYTQLLGGAPGDYKVSYKNCTIVANATHRGLIVTGANAATIKIEKLTKVPTKHADVAGKTLFLIGSPGLDFLTATGTIKSLSGTGAFIPTITADITGSIKMGVADTAIAAPATSILSATSGTLPSGPALKISLSGVTLDNLVTSQAAAIKIGAKKIKGATVPAGVTAGGQILVGPGLSLGVTGGDMLADLVQSNGGIKSLTVKGGDLGQTLTTATLATILTPAAVSAVQNPSTVVISGLHSGDSNASADGIGKVSAGTIHGVFVAGGDLVGDLIAPKADAAVKSWGKTTSASGDAFVKEKAKTQPAGIVEHLTAP